MQITTEQITDGDVVLDAAGTEWKRAGGTWESFDTSTNQAGPTGEVTLLVRQGAQMCCTPSGTLPPGADAS